MRSITWDVATVAVAAILLAYCFLIHKHRSLSALISVYIGYIVAVSWGETVVGFFLGEHALFNQVWIRANATPHLIRSILFLLVVVLVTFFVKLTGRRSRYSLPEVALYCAGAVALGVVFMLSFLPLDLREAALKSSKVVTYLFRWREWLVLAPVIVMVFFGIYGNDD